MREATEAFDDVAMAPRVVGGAAQHPVETGVFFLGQPFESLDRAALNGPVFGAPLPLLASNVPVCVVNRYKDPITGTANYDTGDINLHVTLLSDVFFVNMAVTMMAGLGFATVLTLIVVPTLYCIFFRIDPGRPGN